MSLFWLATSFAVSIYLMAYGAKILVKNSPAVSKILHLSAFATTFLVIGVISVLPEFTISIISSLRGSSNLGLGTIFGSNVADLTLVLGIAALFSRRGLKVRSDFLARDIFFIIPLALPIVLGAEGNFSRTDGIIMILVGGVFFYFLYRSEHRKKILEESFSEYKKTLKLITTMSGGFILLLGGGWATVVVGQKLAYFLSLPEVLIGISFITLGTLLPELVFSLKAAKDEQGELVLGDILGIVITDTTLVLGIMALINPFDFARNLIFITGFAMVLAAIISLDFMKTGRVLSRREGVVLILLYIFFLSVEFSLQKGVV